MKKENEKLFPVIYKGKEYQEEDCNSDFLCFYHTRSALNSLGGVYLAGGEWIYPDGTIKQY